MHEAGTGAAMLFGGTLAVTADAQLEILDSVVSLVAIEMVDRLLGKQ
jgi:hypothetical protein